MFDHIVATSGLAEVIAGPAIRRALAKAQVDPKHVTPDGLAKALGALEACLRVYLPEHEVPRRMAALRDLARQSPR